MFPNSSIFPFSQVPTLNLNVVKMYFFLLEEEWACEINVVEKWYKMNESQDVSSSHVNRMKHFANRSSMFSRRKGKERRFGCRTPFGGRSNSIRQGTKSTQKFKHLSVLKVVGK